VGKSTMLKMLAEETRTIVSLDDTDVRYFAKTDPALFLQRYKPPVLIDEIQYAPELLPYIKKIVDSSGQNGGFWLTGSQAFHLMKNVSESLAGRVGIVSLLGLSSSEINAVESVPFDVDVDLLVKRMDVVPQMDVRDVFFRVFKGAMPKLYADDTVDWEIYYRSYTNTYLQRDIKDLTQVADEMSFLHFMTAVAARTARPVVYEELAKEVGISAPTAKKWLSILVSSQIVAIVQPYFNNVLKRMTKMPLLHFLDTGLCAYLLKWSNPDALEKGAMSGQFFESYVFAEIYKSYINAGIEPPVYYYRDKDKKEIDLLLYKNGMMHPIEIKKSASPGKEAIKHFNVLEPLTEPEKFGDLAELKVEVGTGAVICMASDINPVNRGNWRVPVWLI
jgi:predicted AAA+ superfamily ATPase